MRNKLHVHIDKRGFLSNEELKNFISKVYPKKRGKK